MKINQIDFDKSQTSKVGLSEIKLERLGNVVALVGKNGSGKTRFLNLLEENFVNITRLTNLVNGTISNVPIVIQDALSELEKYKEIILKQEQLQKINQERRKDPKNRTFVIKYQELRKEIRALEIKIMASDSSLPNNSVQERINQLTNIINPLIARFRQDYLKRISYAEIRQLQEAISDNENDPTSFEQLIESVTDNLEYNELGSIYKSSLRFLRRLPHQLAYDWIDCLGDQVKFEKRVAYSRYISLKKIFEDLFGKELEWVTKNVSKSVTEQGVQSILAGNWKINGRDFNYSEFSEGEKTLFAYVLLFFLISQNKNIRLRDSIIIIDEPELHLHPDSEIELINGIRNIIGETGQLWIATHSINILSHLNFDEVFVVKDGVIHRPSSGIQREALSELMKIEERVQKLSEFITSISEWTYVQFMMECFTNPDVIEIAKSNDPQVESLKEILRLNSDSKSTVLLDFGAGKGRLFEHTMQDHKFRNAVDYYALEPNTEFHPILSSKGVRKVYTTYDELGVEAFDFVVLCNVLHEIEIDEWIPCLNKIINSLKPSGQLIILEAKTLSKGEKVKAIGYLMLDEFEIMRLFGLQSVPRTLQRKGQNNNISCVIIPKSDMTNVSITNLIETMDALESNTLKKIENLRIASNNVEPNSKFGRQSAFLSQLHINSRLAKKYIKSWSAKSTDV